MSTPFPRPYPKYLIDTLKILVSSLQYHYNLWNSVALEISKLDSFDLDRNIREIKNVKVAKNSKIV